MKQERIRNDQQKVNSNFTLLFDLRLPVQLLLRGNNRKEANNLGQQHTHRTI